MGTSYRTLIEHLIPSLQAVGDITIHVTYSPCNMISTIGGITRIYRYASLEEMYHSLLFLFEVFQQENRMTPEERFQEQWAAITKWSPSNKYGILAAAQAGDMKQVIQYSIRFHQEMIRSRIQRLLDELGMKTLTHQDSKD